MLGCVLALGALWTYASTAAFAGGPPQQFERIATYIVCENSSCDTTLVETTVAEIVAASRDGRTLVYTDSPANLIGLVDISDPAHPKGLGTVKLDGEPTSVDVAGRYALVAVNTRESFANPSGHLAVFDLHQCRADLNSCTPLTKLDMGGQPDSVAVSPDKRYAAIAIENERDEDVNDGALPQLPGGFLNIVDLVGPPSNWVVRTVPLTGLAQIAPEDPEPEYVKINRFNVAAVTLQENNHIALVYLPTGKVLKHFSAGATRLADIDVEENRVIELNGEIASIKREPDGIAWVGDWRLATANEGDLEGGSRGFSIFGARGRLLFDSGNGLEHLAVKHGHYPEDRAENKGVEPEGVVSARFGSDEYVFVGSERANFVAVYRDRSPRKPEFVQLLPTGIGPEGLLAIPERKLFVASTEVDEGARAQINIYRLRQAPASYPGVVSAFVRQDQGNASKHGGKAAGRSDGVHCPRWPRTGRKPTFCTPCTTTSTGHRASTRLTWAPSRRSSPARWSCARMARLWTTIWRGSYSAQPAASGRCRKEKAMRRTPRRRTSSSRSPPVAASCRRSNCRQASTISSVATDSRG
jgi:hypothetical protein